ncbi:MAG TPA: cyclic nucleotide-binding domain-containing protein, partial [Candidatus Nanopelagicales bacterium]|nr:cyclic nucleotide-binding domain-containing protein [Candidatus Nanopelagicales bacterium]
MARNVRVQPGAPGGDGGLDLDARKRRIIRRGAIGNAASPATQTVLAEAGTIQRIAKGRPLVTQGEPAAAISMLSLGRVRLTRGLSDGKTLSLGYRGAGDILGEAVLGGVQNHRESAIATEDVEALLVPVQAFKNL